MTPLRPLDLIPIIPPLDINIYGPIAEPWLIKSCEHDAEWSIDEIKAGLADGRFLLWVYWDTEKKACIGACVTRMSINKRGEKIGHVEHFAGNDLNRMIPCTDRVTGYFREHGCNKWRFASSRKGWVKKFPHMRLAGVILEEVFYDVLR